MPNYCRAYYVKDLRQFNGWNDHLHEFDADLSDEDIVYVWDDFTVVKSPVIQDKGILLNTVTSEWREFCLSTLQFNLPEDLHSTSEQE